MAGDPRRTGRAGPSPPPEAPSMKSRACLLVKCLREPDAVEPHVRFDERRRETEPRPRLRHRHDGESRRQQLLPRPTVTAPAGRPLEATLREGSLVATGSYSRLAM